MEDEQPSKIFDGGEAVGAYLRFLREKKGLSAQVVADRIGTNQAQVWRIEHWKSDTRSSLLFRFIKAVGGDVRDVELLINKPKATAEEGETLAKLRLDFSK